ncbi:MAG: phosphohydrolase [Clostridia bacterium]|nr:phosphohydrolase [Clostridia bacterium]
MNKENSEQILLKEFVLIVRDIILSPEFREMKNYKHHVKGTLYDHSVKVAYLCFRHQKRFGLKTDVNEFVRGAILHDYYLYDLHGGNTKHRLHWFRHPKRALEKATEKYPTLTHVQRDMIERHMFPLTLIPPKTKAGWLVCFYDKVAVLSDRLGKKSKTDRNEKWLSQK